MEFCIEAEFKADGWLRADAEPEEIVAAGFSERPNGFGAVPILVRAERLGERDADCEAGVDNTSGWAVAGATGDEGIDGILAVADGAVVGVPAVGVVGAVEIVGVVGVAGAEEKD